jgi:glycosyltransferase involved in cell wall biosynthesis
MRILWISHFLLYPQIGYGALQRSRNLLLELCKKHEVSLVSYYRKVDLQLVSNLQEAKGDLEKYCKKVVLIPYPLDQNKLLKHILPIKSLFSTTPYSVNFYRSKVMMKEVVKMINTYNIDIVHTDTLGLIDEILDNIKAIKILNHHNIESDMMRRRAQDEKNFAKKLFLLREAYLLKNYESKFCPRYDLNIVVSTLDDRRLREINKDVKTVVIENGVDCDYYRYYPRTEECKGLIFVGLLDWEPNTDAMVFFIKEVWPLLKKRFNNLTLTVIGRNPPKKLQDAIDESDGIILKGFVKDVRPFVKRAKVFICPLRVGGGTRLKILDALAQGIPVVSTEIGCKGLGLEDYKNVLIANTPQEFMEKIGQLLTDKELCNRLSRNGRVFVEKEYSFNIIGEKLSSLYEQIIFPHN